MSRAPVQWSNGCSRLRGHQGWTRCRSDIEAAPRRACGVSSFQIGKEAESRPSGGTRGNIGSRHTTHLCAAPTVRSDHRSGPRRWHCQAPSRPCPLRSPGRRPPGPPDSPIDRGSRRTCRRARSARRRLSGARTLSRALRGRKSDSIMRTSPPSYQDAPRIELGCDVVDLALGTVTKPSSQDRSRQRHRSCRSRQAKPLGFRASPAPKPQKCPCYAPFCGRRHGRRPENPPARARTDN